MWHQSKQQSVEFTTNDSPLWIRDLDTAMTLVMSGEDMRSSEESAA